METLYYDELNKQIEQNTEELESKNNEYWQSISKT